MGIKAEKERNIISKGKYDRIIDTQVQEGYFQDCPISWQEINRVKETFKEKLRTMYHTRISYPDATVGPDQKKQ